MGEAGDERRQRDDDDDGDEEVRAAVGARRRPGFLPRVREASAVGVELQAGNRKGRRDEVTVLKIF